MNEDYFLVVGGTVFDLNKKVNIRLRNGWQLYGPTFMSIESEYCQPMTRNPKQVQTYDSWKDLVEVSIYQRNADQEGDMNQTQNEGLLTNDLPAKEVIKYFPPNVCIDATGFGYTNNEWSEAGYSEDYGWVAPIGDGDPKKVPKWYLKRLPISYPPFGVHLYLTRIKPRHHQKS